MTSKHWFDERLTRRVISTCDVCRLNAKEVPYWMFLGSGSATDLGDGGRKGFQGWRGLPDVPPLRTILVCPLVSPPKWLESDPKSAFSDPKRSLLSHMSLLGSLLSHFGGGPRKSLFSHFWPTLNFSGFRGSSWFPGSEFLTPSTSVICAGMEIISESPFFWSAVTSCLLIDDFTGRFSATFYHLSAASVRARIDPIRGIFVAYHDMNSRGSTSNQSPTWQQSAARTSLIISPGAQEDYMDQRWQAMFKKCLSACTKNWG